MTSTDFKKAWKEIEGKAINVAYGKQVFKNIILKDYNEEAATVKTTMQGLLNTRAIKSIELVEHRPEIHPEMLEFIKFDIERGKEEFVEAEVVEVTPKLPENWNENGYFIIVGKLGGNWKHVELRDKAGDIVRNDKEIKSGLTFEHSTLFNWVLSFKNAYKEKCPKFLIDDSFSVPQYYKIELHGLQRFFAN